MGLTTDAAHVRRGVGFGVSIKNLMYSEGFDDYSTARCRLEDGRAVLKFATAEVGQGFVTLAAQIARTNLGVDDVVLEQLASSFATLTEDEKELGVCLVDIGGGTTDLAVFSNGAIRHTAVIPIAGDQVTNDIAVSMRTPTHYAEDIKVRYACALSQLANPDESIEVPSVGDRPARRLARQCGKLGLIVVDYLQLMSVSGGMADENRATAVGEISRGLKMLAKELQCPVIALSQLSRQVENREDKRPQLADLRESGIPLDADTFRSVVHDGALMSRGMGAFAELSDAELEGLRHYIRQRARATMPAPGK